VTLVGLARQLVDPNTSEGQAASGVSLKVRLIPMTATARGKARPWDEGAPRIIGLLQQVDALEETKGGFGRPWKAATEDPTIERGSILPEDPLEELTYNTTAVTADIMSIETAVTNIHPDWDEAQVAEEVKKILDENAAASGFGAGFGDTVDTTSTDGTGGTVDDTGATDNGSGEPLTQEEFDAQYGAQ
jgi:hypothetical protein